MGLPRVAERDPGVAPLSLFSIQLAATTLSTSITFDNRVGFIEAVTVVAMSLCRVRRDDGVPAHEVLAVCYRLKMFWIHTVPVPTTALAHMIEI